MEYILKKPIRGVDISYAQPGFDLSAAKKEGIAFAIIRAGIAVSKDSELDSHVLSAKKADMPYGFYWYSYVMNVSEAEKEADACLDAIKKYYPLYPVFYDMELKQQITGLTTSQRTDIAEAFCKRITAGGFMSGIYTNVSWMENYYLKNRLIGKYEIWLAYWTDNPNIKPPYDYGQTIWQWGLDNVNDTDVDGDVCYIDYPAKLKDFYKNIHHDDPDKPQSFKVGDKVWVKRGATAYYGEKLASFVYDTLYTVLQVGIKSDPDYIVIGLDGKVTAAVNADDLVLDTSDNKPDPSLSVGDKVKVKAGSTDFNGKPLAPFVYDNIYTVMQVGTNSYPDYIVIGQNGNVTAAVKASSLIKI